MRRALLAVLLRAVALALLPPATADVIFRVPEVMARPVSGSRPVGIGPANASRANDSERWSEPDAVLQYEEYYVEHEVSTADARKAADLLNVEDIPATVVGCGVCSRRDLEYCETRVLADHCCCERQFVREPFPWLPHTCYVGPHRCRPLAHDCVRYVRLRDCCCYRKLAERWKGILSKSSRVSVEGASLLLSTLLLVLLL
ncbi:uncharacterized protein LOC112047742 [Bicyclus anynana]|uniref:Uncharacterized protein LOC112047742 n=1 Tax=Bicyclus anynana TaxID=110368 RepID=A0A6J1N6T5_BICAN|nr:uncharacterized protein LOC112047742 [Bicyclus anynana]